MSKRIVSNLEQARARRLAAWMLTRRGIFLVCASLAFLWFGFYYGILKGAHPTLLSDSYEYAQVARNLVEGRGLTTNTATVLEYARLKQWGFPLPYFFHDIGNPLLLALFFRIFGTADRVIGWMSGAFYVLIPPLAALVGMRLYNRRVGLLVGLFCVVAPQLIVFSTTGYSELPYAFFLTFALLLLYTRREWWGILLTGLICGWLVVLRSNSLPYLLLFVFYLAIETAVEQEVQFWRGLRRGWRQILLRVALFALGVCVCIVPNSLRNAYYLGNPLYNINSMYALVWYTSAIQTKVSGVFNVTTLDVDPLSFVLSYPYELVNKMYFQLARVFPQILSGGITNTNNWLDFIFIFVFVLSIIAPNRAESTRQRRFRFLVYAMIVAALFFGAVFNLRWRHLYGFIPIVLLYVAEWLVRNRQSILNLLGARTKQPNGKASYPAVQVLVVILVLMSLGLSPVVENIRPADTLQINGSFIDLARVINENTEPSAVILTDGASYTLQIQNGLAWYNKRQYLATAPTTLRAMLKQSAPLYLLRTQSPLATEPFPEDVKVPGFVPIALWRQGFGNVAAVLYKRQ